jgi:glutaminyl-tRNA synthetase
MSPDGRKVRGTLHWVSARHALDAELRLYDYLFTKPDPYEVEEGGEFTDNINPDSLQVVKNAKLEPSLQDAALREPFQFMRQGYFCTDKDSTPDALVFNRTISLVDTWAKIKKQRGK